MEKDIHIQLLDEEVKPKEYTEADINDILSKAEIREEHKISKPPVLLEMISKGYQNFTPVLTLGNISTIKGKAKSRKTFATTLLMSACSYKESLDNILFNREPDRHTLFFDTEQSEYHVFRTVQRVSGIRNLNYQSSNFWGFCLRPYSPEMRTKIIEHTLYNFKYDIGLVVIDGIRDLIYDINDQKEAVTITTKLLKWSKEKNCHILNIIHENKGDGNARGHIGSEIQNKCETVISVKKDEIYSIMSPELTRDAEFNDITFKIEKNEKCFVPIIVDNFRTNNNF